MSGDARIGGAQGRAAAAVPRVRPLEAVASTRVGEGVPSVEAVGAAAGSRPLPGRTFPAGLPRPPASRRYSKLIVLCATLLLVFAGLLVWVWRDAESTRARLARSMPAGYDGRISPWVPTDAPLPLSPPRPASTPPAPTSPLGVLPMEPAGPIGTESKPAVHPATAPDTTGSRVDAQVGSEEALPAKARVASEEEPAPPAAGTATAPRMDAAVLIARGNDYLARSDIASARLFYRRAAEGGSGEAAAAMAGTYDPIVLERRRVQGVTPDPGAALDWYRRSADLGYASANTGTEDLLRRLQSQAVGGDARARFILDRALR